MTATNDTEQLYGNEPKSQKENSGGELVGHFRANPVSIAVFKNERDEGTFYNFVPQRSYTTDDGETYEQTSSMRPKDLRKLARLCEEAADQHQEVRFNKAKGGD